jgi:hypothetical protein
MDHVCAYGGAGVSTRMEGFLLVAVVILLLERCARRAIGPVATAYVRVLAIAGRSARFGTANSG